MIAKLFNIALALLFALLSSLTCLHGIATPNFKVIIAAITLFFIMVELALYYILGKLVTGNRPVMSGHGITCRELPTPYKETSLLDKLSRMEPEWIVLKNFYRQGIEADFVVIGPTGVYIISVKEVRGELDKPNDFILLNNTRAIGNFMEGVRNQATILQRDFRSFAKRGRVVKPLLCFTRARLSMSAAGLQDGVLVTSPDDIVATITEGTPIIDSFDVYGIYTFLSKNSIFSKLSTHNPFRGCFIAPEPDVSETKNAPRLVESPEGALRHDMIGASP